MPEARVIPTSPAWKDAVARNLELGKEWRKGYDRGFTRGWLFGALWTALTFGALGWGIYAATR